MTVAPGWDDVSVRFGRDIGITERQLGDAALALSIWSPQHDAIAPRLEAGFIA